MKDLSIRKFLLNLQDDDYRYYQACARNAGLTLTSLLRLVIAGQLGTKTRPANTYPLITYRREEKD